jgi:uncharacterized protein YceK
VKVIVLIILAMLSGCATYFDSQDPCQQQPYPSWCGASDNRTVIYNTRNEPVGYTKRP